MLFPTHESEPPLELAAMAEMHQLAFRISKYSLEGGASGALRPGQLVTYKS